MGLVAAAHLARSGVPVTVFEAGPNLSEESRASTFHPPTLDMLHALGAADAMIAQGLKAPSFQYRSKKHGVIGRFDFGAIADATPHPFRLQCEQSKLTRILADLMHGEANFELQFDSQVVDLNQDTSGVEVTIERNGKSERSQEKYRGRYLIGADGASSKIRRALGIEFEGFTWPDRLLVVSTPFDFPSVIPGLDSVSYVADPQRWHFLLQIPDLWRVMFQVNEDASDERVQTQEFAQSLMAGVVPGITDYEIDHITLYKVHQRVAKTFRHGRAFLVGDAAHINNPLGGMGMNGGIHDAINLADKLADVWFGRADASVFDRYTRQRRNAQTDFVQAQSIQNKKTLGEKDPATRRKHLDELRRTSEDVARHKAFLYRSSLIDSLNAANAVE